MIESHCGLKVKTELVDEYWEKRNREPMKEEVNSWDDVKIEKSL